MMKRIIITLITVTTLLLCMPISALANSFGVSPSSVEINVPKDGVAVQEFTLIGEGSVDIFLVDVPLTISPTEVDISGTETVAVTFEGDGTSNTYEGEIRFLNMYGENVGAGIIVHLTVHVNCTAEVVAPPTPASSGGGSGGGGEEGLIYAVETDIFGSEETYYTGYDGGISKTIVATSEDGNLTVTIPKGTTIKDENGKGVKSLNMALDDDPPTPPESTNIIGLPYDFNPTGTVFEPPITFTWSYDPNALPEGIAEENLVLAYYIDGEWVNLECVVDTETNTITALVSHFTTFAIIGAATPPVVPITPAPAVVPEPSPLEFIVTLEPLSPIVPVPSVIPIEPAEVLAPIVPEVEADYSWIFKVSLAICIPMLVIATVFLIRRRRSIDN